MQQQEQAIHYRTQDARHPGFVARDKPFDCQRCIIDKGKKHGFPGEIDVANIEAWTVYQLVRGQQRAGGLTLLGLDITVLPFVFELYNVPFGEQRLLFEKIAIIDAEVRRRLDEKQEAQQAEEKAKELARQKGLL